MKKEALEFRDEFDEMYSFLAPTIHEKWKEDYRREKPDATHAFRVIPDESLREDAAWIRKNKNKPWYRSSEVVATDPETGKKINKKKHEIDLLALSLDTLSPSRQTEVVASLKIALDELKATLREKRPLDDTFIERAAKSIHLGWVDRNRQTCLREIAERSKSTDPNDIALVERRREQLLPYSDYNSSQKISPLQRNYDRQAAYDVLSAYRQRHPELSGMLFIKNDLVKVSEGRLGVIKQALNLDTLPSDEGTVVSVLGSQASVSIPGIDGRFAVDFTDLKIREQKDASSTQ